MKVNATSLAQDVVLAMQPNTLPPGGGVTMGDSVYPQQRPAPCGNRRHPGVLCTMSSLSVRSFVVDGTVCNPFTHEFGHILGLPDEYDAFPPGGGLVPLVAQVGWQPKFKAILYWVQCLQENNIAVPGWGNFGIGPNLVNEHSLMRDVDLANMRDRHYVTVLEAVRFTASRNHILGTWALL